MVRSTVTGNAGVVPARPRLCRDFDLGMDRRRSAWPSSPIADHCSKGNRYARRSDTFGDGNSGPRVALESQHLGDGPISGSATEGVVIEFKQIICPVDFSDSSVRAFAHAAAIAHWYDARLTVLHVVPTFEPLQVRGDLGDPVRIVTPMPREQMLEEMSRTQERLRRLVAEESRTWVEIDDAVVFGRAHREVLRAAETKSADLIVMGAQGRGGIGLALFGSATPQVVRGATCPVLTVRELPQSNDAKRR